MKKNIVTGTLAFAALSAAFGLGIQAILEQVGHTPELIGQLANFFIAIPSALICGRLVGRVTHISAFIASLVLAVTTLWLIVFILNSVAEPVGGHVSLSSMLATEYWGNTLFGVVELAVVPQIWLLVFNRMAGELTLEVQHP